MPAPHPDGIWYKRAVEIRTLNLIFPGLLIVGLSLDPGENVVTLHAYTEDDENLHKNVVEHIDRQNRVYVTQEFEQNSAKFYDENGQWWDDVPERKDIPLCFAMRDLLRKKFSELTALCETFFRFRWWHSTRWKQTLDSNL
ncbi:hypothetical protein L873DRAFT_1794552 [Choiromyces venosus 120613-1]|uniref:Uncharacterized protein n=1 Tax=Choiromyces venosus 120613-1 TaxID=1336337 RepID=A0A3N4J5V5_9PEZI|nr:hypothetical protein L873DRAFT_1794552 [Choiromyces venosus 120613-1]